MPGQPPLIQKWPDINMRILLSSVFVLTLISTQAYALTLQEALRLTAKNNPILQASNLQTQGVQLGEDIAVSGAKPNLSANLNGGVAATDTDISQRETLTPANASINLVQPIYRGGRTAAEMAQAAQLTTAATANQQALTQTILLQAGTVFMDTLRAQAVENLQQQNLAVLARQLQDEQTKEEVGVVTNTDVSQAKARHAAATAALAAAVGDLRATEAQFVALVGEPPIKLKDPTGKLKLPATLDEATNMALGQHPQLKAARAAAQAGQEQVQVIAGENRPTLNAVGSVGYSRDSSTQLESLSDGRAMLQLDIPIYTQGRVQARQAQATKVAASQQQQIAATERQVRQDVVGAWQAYVTVQANQKARIVQQDAAKVALEGVRAENQNGTRTTLDVLNAQQELLNAQVGQVQANRDYWVAQLQLLASTGQLNPQSIGANLPSKMPSTPVKSKKPLAKTKNPA